MHILFMGRELIRKGLWSRLEYSISASCVAGRQHTLGATPTSAFRDEGPPGGC